MADLQCEEFNSRVIFQHHFANNEYVDREVYRGFTKAIVERGKKCLKKAATNRNGKINCSTRV